MVAASLLVLFDTQKHAEAETMLLPSSPLSEILHQHLLWCGFLARMSTTLSILRLCCACLHRYQYSCTQLDYNRTHAGVCVCVRFLKIDKEEYDELSGLVASCYKTDDKMGFVSLNHVPLKAFQNSPSTLHVVLF
jgi:hypothetical protein